MNESDKKTELLRQIWRLVGERRDVIAKRDELHVIVDAWCSRDDDDADDDHATLAGMRLIDKACDAGLRENTELVVEALGLLAKLDEAAEEKLPVDTNRSVSNCRSCDAQVMWTVTHKGKKMPVDIHASPDGNLVVTIEEGGGLTSRPVDPLLDKPPFFVSHFSTCPDGAKWRKEDDAG